MQFIFKRSVVSQTGGPAQFIEQRVGLSPSSTEALAEAVQMLNMRLSRDAWEYLVLYASTESGRDTINELDASHPSHRVDGERDVRRKSLPEALTILGKERWELVSVIA